MRLPTFLPFRRRPPPTERLIQIPTEHPSPYCSNSISTSKYNIITILPKFLFEQFSLYANLFFLFTAIIQQIDGVSPTSRFSTVIPLALMLIISFVKEGVEDIKRHSSDAEVNNRSVLVLKGGGGDATGSHTSTLRRKSKALEASLHDKPHFTSQKWTSVKVGDIVKVTNNEPFPADLVLLSSSEPDAICYVETSNLDGETNLKIKQGRTETSGYLTPEAVGRLRAEIVGEVPNSSLYTYEGMLRADPKVLPNVPNKAKDSGQSDSTTVNRKGTLTRQTPSRRATVSSMDLQRGRSQSGFLDPQKTQDVMEIPLAPTQVLLRGSVLKNTSWVYAIVVFTGHETKLLRNASATPIKMTHVDRMTNIQILFLFGILLAMSLASSAGTWIRDATFGDQLWYLRLDLSNLGVQFLYNILTFLVLYNNLIPISLMVSREFVKYIQSGFINSDIDMYYPETNTPANCRTSSLVEELGQIEYVFSDKTGTLTRNIMEFRECCIGGRCYALTINNPINNSMDASRNAQANDNPKGMTSSGLLPVYDFDRLQSDITENPSEQIRHTLNEFLVLLASCHTVIPEVQEDTGKITFQASSPDEGALVEGAEMLGYKFHTRRPQTVTINMRGEDVELEILNVCEFNSSRKRMSTVVRHPDGRITLYTKGADTVILERLDKNAPENGIVDTTLTALGEYASEGLRTLCIAYRDVPKDEYESWAKVYEKASIALTDRSGELDRAAELIEKDLILLGATAIEDKLQEGVPETIHILAQAGIKIWVLTGDRQETAINIGYSAKLLTEEMSLIICNEVGKDETRQFLETKLSQLRGRVFQNTVFNAVKRNSVSNGSTSSHEGFLDPHGPMALIIDGKCLDFALDKDIEKLFLDVATQCKAVICCRVSPLQKALVVKLVKRSLKTILLAIGDGANDVSMIQAAHVGVGISGQEGMQAARSADIAIAQFRFLRKLILVHGAWSYNRLAKLILYSFYKNIALYMTQFWFALFNGFSGQTIYESWMVSLFNVLFAVAPPMVMGIYEQYVGARMLDRYPQLYSSGREHVFFNVKNFWAWTFNSVYHSIVIFFVVTIMWGDEIGTAGGQAYGLWAIGMVMYTSVVGVITVRAALYTDWWVVYAYLAIFGSMVLWIVVFPIYSIVAPSINNFSIELLGTGTQLYSSAKFWLSVIVSILIATIRDYTYKYYRRTYRPKTYHIVQEIQKFNTPDYRPRMERFRKAIHKVRMIQRLRRTQGYAFSQSEHGQADLIRIYDTTLQKPKG